MKEICSAQLLSKHTYSSNIKVISPKNQMETEPGILTKRFEKR